MLLGLGIEFGIAVSLAVQSLQWTPSGGRWQMGMAVVIRAGLHACGAPKQPMYLQQLPRR